MHSEETQGPTQPRDAVSTPAPAFPAPALALGLKPKDPSEVEMPVGKCSQHAETPGLFRGDGTGEDWSVGIG